MSKIKWSTAVKLGLGVLIITYVSGPIFNHMLGDWHPHGLLAGTIGGTIVVFVYAVLAKRYNLKYAQLTNEATDCKSVYENVAMHIDTIYTSVENLKDYESSHATQVQVRSSCRAIRALIGSGLGVMPKQERHFAASNKC